MSENTEEFYLFRVNGRAAGMAVLSQDRDKDAPIDCGEICAIYFLPEYWGQGYEWAAMDFCVKRLMEKGFKSIVLWVLEKNESARRFYNKYGFSENGRKKEIFIAQERFTECKYELTPKLAVD